MKTIQSKRKIVFKYMSTLTSTETVILTTKQVHICKLGNMFVGCFIPDTITLKFFLVDFATI